jgi:hypothetical protein
MNPLKKSIFIEIRNSYLEYKNASDEDLNKIIFHMPAGLRLSLRGFIVVKSIFTAYSFEIPITIKTRHRKNMSTFVYPYFFTKNRLILFSSMDAMTISLCGGLEQFLENCSTIDKNA